MHKPGKQMVLFAVVCGLFLAWWSCFHEAVCGCLSVIESGVEYYKYIDCLAHYAGIALGAILFVLALLLLLVAATFWIGNGRQAAKLWGLRREMTPQKFAESELQGRCAVLAQRFGLTPKETEILQLSLAGRRPTQIAEDLVVSVNTVRSHIRNIYAKANVHSATELEQLSRSVDERDVVPNSASGGSQSTAEEQGSS